jgi:Lon protease-like protein
MFPLGTVLIPGEILPLHIFESRYREMTTAVLEGDHTFGVILISRGAEVGGGDQRVGIGTLARVVESAPFSDGRYALLVRGECRLEVLEWLSDEPFPQAHVRELPSIDAPGPTESISRALSSVRHCRALLSELGVSLGPWNGALEAVDADEASWQLGSLAPFGAFDKQRILEIDDPFVRVELIAELCDAIADDTTRLLSAGPEIS